MTIELKTIDPYLTCPICGAVNHVDEFANCEHVAGVIDDPCGFVFTLIKKGEKESV